MMSLHRTNRRAFASVLATLVFVAASGPAVAQPGGQRGGGPRMNAPSQRIPSPGARNGRNQEHFLQWMDRHSNLPIDQQQRALESEPGFRDLPSDTQQRLRNRLTELNNMQPDQRRRLLEHNEAIAHLTAPQRQQFRGAMQQFSSLPPDRRLLVRRAFRDLREMPEPQRQALLNSDRFRSQFSDEERGTLSNLLAVEPYFPARKSNETPDTGK